MKRKALLFTLLLGLLLCILPATAMAADGIAVDEAHFPDANFRDWILSQEYGEDGVLTQWELEGVTEINVNRMRNSICDLTGIEYFTSLVRLECGDNQLTSLDVSNNPALKYLVCGTNQLTSLDVSHNPALETLTCSENRLTSLDVSNNPALKTLSCSNNQLTSLDLSNNPALEILGCSDNQLTSLDMFYNPELERLYCAYNELTSLDVSFNPELEYLECNNNQLTSLDVSFSPVLESLDCSNNQLTRLRVDDNPALYTLICEYNQLTSLDVSSCTALTNLLCERNQLTSLDVSWNINLNNISCEANQLNDLNIDNCVNLTQLECNWNQLTDLDTTDNMELGYLNCSSNQLTGLDVSRNVLLKTFMCTDNQLTELNLTQNLELVDLYCSNNQLTRLDVTMNAKLDYFFCDGNQLTELDLSLNRQLRNLNCKGNRLTTLDLSANTNLGQLECSENQLTSLDLTGNPSWISLTCYDNRYTVEVDENGRFDLSTLPGAFDVTKASDWSGGSVSGSVLTFDSGSSEVTYTYQVNESETAIFTLVIDSQPTGPIRIFGSNRYETAFNVADALLEVTGTSKFGSIIVASGNEFPDALAGSYLATVKGAPILLVNPRMCGAVKEYITANLIPGGTVYLLGGVNAVPAEMETGLDGYNVVRLAGANRYETNLAILNEAGATDEPILVCTGTGFADSLSASAVGAPILLVNPRGLTQAQKDYLAGGNRNFIIIGGESAVPLAIAEALAAYGTVDRLAGANRYETSVMVAQMRFREPASAVLAYAQNFPDGLCGGPLANAMNAPLLLTATNRGPVVAEYAQENGITSGIVLGGETLIDDATTRNVFSLSSDALIVAP